MRCATIRALYKSTYLNLMSASMMIIRPSKKKNYDDCPVSRRTTLSVHIIFYASCLHDGMITFLQFLQSVETDRMHF